MTSVQIAFIMRKDDEESTELETARAYALVCQDLQNEFFVMWGPEAELRDLYCWGLLNFGVASPLPDLVHAVDDTLRPEIGDGTNLVTVRQPARLPEDDAPSALDVPWTMDVRIGHDAEPRIILAGMTDLVLLCLDGNGKKKSATGGSGMQKSNLMETGIKVLFGEETALRFERAYHGERSAFVMNLRQRMLRSRRRVADGSGYSIVAVTIPLDNEDE